MTPFEAEHKNWVRQLGRANSRWMKLTAFGCGLAFSQEKCDAARVQYWAVVDEYELWLTAHEAELEEERTAWQARFDARRASRGDPNA